MRITFLCGSLEPGKDGVGDYARCLCGELIRKGNSASMVSLRDRHLPKGSLKKEIQLSRGTKIECLRMNSTLSWKERIQETGDFVEAQGSEWMSLQFVPYAYHMKGLPFRLPYLLEELNNRLSVSWHIMFHELGDDLAQHPGIKDRIVAILQKRIITCLQRKLNFPCTSTQTETYRQRLNKWIPGIAGQLPLFSNVEMGSTDIKRASALFGLSEAERGDYLVGLFFGNIHPFPDFPDALRNFARTAQSRNKIPYIAHVGRLAARYEKIWNSTMATLPAKVRIKRLGELPEEDISSLISWSDLGISTTPWTLAEKSGGAFAFLEAGKHVWILQDPLPGYPPSCEGLSLDLDVCIENNPFIRPALSDVADKFLEHLALTE